MRAASEEAGFTLVELLVSMALLGMAAVLVAQGFSADRRLLQTVEGRASAGEDVAAAQDLIRDRIEHLFPQAQFDSLGPHVLLTGSAGDLEFMTFASKTGDVPQIESQKLALSEKGDLALTPDSSTGASDANDNARVLLHGVQGVELAYYGATKADLHPGWRSTWQKETDPPQLVRVRLDFAQGDRRAWPELIVRPAVTVDTACILDVTAAVCRGRR